MITVKYETDFIKLCPDNSDDNMKLVDLFRDEVRVSYFNGEWITPEHNSNWVNIVLIPLKDSLYIDESFKHWRASQTKLEGSPAIIKCGPVFSHISAGSQVLPHKDIEDATKFFLKAAINMEKYKQQKWDGYIKLYKRWERSFPTGLLHEVEVVLTQKGIEFKTQYMYDTSPNKQFNFKICDNKILDRDQIDAVEACVKGERGVCKAPTGMGKTAIIAKRLVAEFGVPSLFIANKKSLLDDASAEFLDGVKGLTKVYQIKDGWFGNTKLEPNCEIKPLDAHVVVATIQSLHARLQDPRTKNVLLSWLRNECKLLIVDECQALGTKTWDDVMNECWAPYRIGLSATPRRTDGGTLKLMASTGPILYSTTAEEQIQKGRLCELQINYQVYNHKIHNEYDTDVNYNETYQVNIVENEDRHLKCILKPTFEMINEGRFVLVLIQRIEHGHILQNLFIKNGMNPSDIMFVWGDTPDKIRQSAVHEFRKGKFKIMIGSTIFDAGVNIPIISGVVLGGAGNSDITLIQRIGRGARNCDYEDLIGYMPEFMKQNHGQKVTKVYDIMDIGIKFFHKQARNRYYNAISEFGKSRVFITGGNSSVLLRPRKMTTETLKHVNQLDAQMKMIEEFS